MSVSIKDIARLAGVSHSTVSRALRNSPLISAETAKRIQQIAQREGYSVSAIARSLVTRRSEAIGVVVTSIADPFNGEVVAGIEEVANRAGYSVLLANSQADPERELSIVQSFQQRRVDGILVASSRVGELYIPVLADLRIPIVLINNHNPSEFVHSVSIDNVHGAYEATKHLIELGHKRIAYIGDQFGLHSDSERVHGYTQALEEYKIGVNPEWIARGDGKPEGGRAAAEHLLALNDRPTAIFCYNDMSSLGLLQAAKSAGLRVPEDLSVVAFDDLFFTPFLNPPLTTFSQPKKRIGGEAAKLLLDRIGGEERRKIVSIRGELVVRGSTSPP